MKTLRVVLIGSLLNLACAATYGQSVFNVTTAAGEFNAGTLNQGWWSDFGGNNTYNDNYCISLGWTAATYPYQQGFVTRGFFTFDLSAVNGPVTSATLLLTRGSCTSPNPTETISFWDVQTPPAALNDNIGPSSSVVGDLGSGINYGSFQVSMVGSPNETLAFPLNPNAIADLNEDLGAYFSIGGSMDGQPAPGVYRSIFGVSQGIPVSLQITVAPEPSVGVLAAVLGVCTALFGTKKRGGWLTKGKSELGL